jgi:tripartite-type tricarboxylate transporter receptor subunit TctC
MHPTSRCELHRAGLGAERIAAGARANIAKIVIGFPHGGSADSTARLPADVLKGAYTNSVVVESRAGAGGVIAA